MAPRVINVCNKCCRSTLPCCAIFAILIGVLSTAATEVVGYYYEYSNKTMVGLCLYTEQYPGIRRACTLDWASGVMGTMLGILIIIIECVATYINQRDWTILFYIIKLCSATTVVILSLAGSIEGIITYYHYCEETRYCKFSDRLNREDVQHQISVDFIIVVVLSAANAAWWIVLLATETVRACLACNVVRPHTRVAAYQPLQSESELDDLPPTPPAYSET